MIVCIHEINGSGKPKVITALKNDAKPLYEMAMPVKLIKQPKPNTKSLIFFCLKGKSNTRYITPNNVGNNAVMLTLPD